MRGDDDASDDDDDDTAANDAGAGDDVDVEEEESNLDPAIEEPVEAVPPPSLRTRRVNFGIVQVQGYKLTLGDHPCCPGRFALALDWPRTAVKKYRVDQYEDAKQRKGPWRPYTEEGRLSVLEEVTGVDRSVWAVREGRRLKEIGRQQRLDRMLELQRRQARREERMAALALQPVRRSARLANKDPPAANDDPQVANKLPSQPALRRSARLANKPRCNYKE